MTEGGAEKRKGLLEERHMLSVFIMRALMTFLGTVGALGCLMSSLGFSFRPGIFDITVSLVSVVFTYAMLHTGYHHLTNWGTTSVFCVIGERKKRPFYDDEGNVSMRDSIDLGLTIDERIADGYYYSKTVRLLRKLLENPELLEQPLNEKVDF